MTLFPEIFPFILTRGVFIGKNASSCVIRHCSLVNFLEGGQERWGNPKGTTMIEDPTDSPDNSTAVAPRLTERQRRWVEEYLADPNGTLAALRAGYAPISAKQQGTENLANPVLRQILDQERQARAIRMRVEADRVVEELMYVGLSDIRDVVTWDAEGKPTQVELLLPMFWQLILTRFHKIQTVPGAGGTS